MLGLENKPEEFIITQLRRLRKIDLGNRQTAYITIDSEPCLTCLQFLNRLFQYTGILFAVPGSQGIGPIKVRVEGRRREDVVADVFSDSGDEIAGADSEPRDVVPPPEPAIAPVTEPTTEPTVEPVAAPRSVLRRPRSYWKEFAAPWIPDDPEEQVSAYKKKTPQLTWPGYDNDSPPPLPKSPAPGVQAAAKESIEEASSSTLSDDDDDDDIPYEWEELGDGLMIRCADDVHSVQENSSIKRQPSPEEEPYGRDYALAAYETVREGLGNTNTVEEAEYEVIERPRQAIRRPHPRYHRRKAPSSARAGQTGVLQKFRHHPARQSSIDESVFGKKYSILQPKNR